jgi:hypothetical protein
LGNAYIVDGNDEDTLVVFEETLQLLEVFLLVSLDPHFFLFDEERIFKVQDSGFVYVFGVDYRRRNFVTSV